MAFRRPKQQPNTHLRTNEFNSQSPRQNPWQHDSPSLSSIRSGLILAQQLRRQKSLVDEYSVAVALAELPSMKQIAAQRDISSKNRALVETRKNIAQLSQEKEVSDVIHLDVIEKRINMITEICTDLDSILKNKDKLLYRLQMPFLQDYIKMDAAYHKPAREVFMQLISSLNDVTRHLDNIMWASHNDFSAATMNPLLVETKSLIASLQTSFQTLHQMGHGIEVLSQS